jgi:hypothetical protein
MENDNRRRYQVHPFAQDRDKNASENQFLN